MAIRSQQTCGNLKKLGEIRHPVQNAYGNQDDVKILLDITWQCIDIAT